MSGNAGAVRFGSVCSGIEAASVAWHPLGWRAAWLAEVDKFPSAVLAHHYPTTPNLGDITASDFAERAGEHGSIDVLVGGTPCQSFSVAGLRAGLADPRGNLALVFLAIADRLRPAWVVWENVPGVLSSGDGRDFGAFLGALGELGYGWSYRVLDAQYFGVAQRRRRVFVVGHLGDWRRAAAVLFERDSLSGNPPPRRETGARVAYAVAAGAGSSKFGSGRDGQDTFVTGESFQNTGHGWWNQSPVAQSLRSEGGGSLEANVVTHSLPAKHNAGDDGTGRGVPLVTHALRADGFDASEDGTGRGTPLVSVAFNTKESGKDATVELMPTLRSESGDPHAGGRAAVASGMAVRRLTPRECERLQGFPDDYTAVPYRGKPAADGPRYKALGNSMAVPVMRWIGERIAAVAGVAA